MLRLGFGSIWVAIVMMCVKSVSYSFLVNGEECGFVVPSRRLRQGDPLSLYLFLFCIEGLSALIKHKEERGVIRGIRICDGAPSVHHLLFADDSFLLGKAKLEECANVQHILDVFSQASGQEINWGKSSIAFNANMRGREQQGFAHFLGVQLVKQHERYLGLPRQTFAYIKERVHKRLCGWKRKCLSGAGRELLMKVVAQALPSYAMNCFLLPKTFCDDLHQLMAQFWWGSDPDLRKIHWKSWDKLCLAKPEGGMGFRNLYAFNLAVLAKQEWRILQDPESLTARLFKAKYHPYSSFWDASVASSSSYCWSSILKARIVLEKGSRWLIGDGAFVRVWKDQLVPRPSIFRPITQLPPSRENMLVYELIDEARRMWCETGLSAYFEEEDMEHIRALPISHRLPPDKLVWHYTDMGQSKVKSAYGVAWDYVKPPFLSAFSSALGGNPFTPLWNATWQAGVPPKVRNMIWRTCQDIIPTKENLSKRGVGSDLLCVLCRGEPEMVVHVLKDCLFARATWFATLCSFLVDFVPCGSVKEWFMLLIQNHHLDFDFMCIVVWHLWLKRNDRIWKGKHGSPAMVAQHAVSWL
ncbi:hypothetical protein ACFX15_038069 [Malus domestica]